MPCGGKVDVHAHVKIHAWEKVNSISGQTDSVACGWCCVIAGSMPWSDRSTKETPIAT